MVLKPPTVNGETPEITKQETHGAELEARVADALARAANTDASRVEVTATGSTITLTGIGEPERVQEIAERVPGVTDVVNLVIVS